MDYVFTKSPTIVDKLEEEILISSISSATLQNVLDTHDVSNNLTITFDVALSVGDVTTLNSLVTAHNGSVQQADAPDPWLLEGLAVNNTALLTPPGSPTIGDLYYINGTGTGGWTGHNFVLAQYDGVTWSYFTLTTGTQVYDKNSSESYYVTSSGALIINTLSDVPNGSVLTVRSGGNINVLSGGSVTVQSGGTITSVDTPVNGSDLTNKSYVDAKFDGRDPKRPVRLTTVAALPTNVYNNGVSGVGATLTASANGALSVDGVAVAIADRLGIISESDATHNGIYVVTATGTAILPYILTRSTDCNIGGNTVFTNVREGLYFLTTEGTQKNTGWILNGTGDTGNPNFTIGTTQLNFTQYTGAADITAASGLAKSGNTIWTTWITAAPGAAPAPVTNAQFFLYGVPYLQIADTSTTNYFISGDRKFLTFSHVDTLANGYLSLTNTNSLSSGNATFLAPQNGVLISAMCSIRSTNTGLKKIGIFKVSSGTTYTNALAAAATTGPSDSTPVFGTNQLYQWNTSSGAISNYTAANFNLLQSGAYPAASPVFNTTNLAHGVPQNNTTQYIKTNFVYSALSFSAGDYLICYAESGGGNITDIVITLEVAWRI